MKSIKECVNWVECFTKGKFGVRPNVEDMNFFNSILHYLEKCEEYERDIKDKEDDLK